MMHDSAPGTNRIDAAFNRPMNAAPKRSPDRSATPAPRILVVEDDILVRTVVAAYLRECGYEAAEAGNADEAIHVIKSDMRIDIVFSDVTIPGSMDGFGLAQWVRRWRPDIKVILTSGAQRTAKAAGELCEDGPMLAKPYDHAELARRIRTLLGR
jgi:CheY-like chemotaxis protein